MVGRLEPGRSLAGNRSNRGRLAVLAAALLLGAGVAGSLARAADAPTPPVVPAPPAARHPVRIHLPPGLGALETGQRSAKGEPVRAACSSCHAEHARPPYVAKAAELKDFHKGLQIRHGELKCAGCHDLADRDRLHLADGTTLPFTEVVQLCSQCHGHQARDYAHGAHGGMNGYWDLSRGGRVRNSCVDCHDPHRPKFPHFAPVLRPRDRFLQPSEGHDGH